MKFSFMQNPLTQIPFFAWIYNSFINSHLLEWLKVRQIKSGIRVNFDQCVFISFWTLCTLTVIYLLTSYKGSLRKLIHHCSSIISHSFSKLNSYQVYRANLILITRYIRYEIWLSQQNNYMEKNFLKSRCSII